MPSLIQRFTLEVTACFAARGHAIRGEHPLGLAIDAVSANRDWSHAMDGAAFGWSTTCAATRFARQARPPMRVVLYNGYPGHGDPAHCASPARAPQPHLSWAHAASKPLTPAMWVATLAHEC